MQSVGRHDEVEAAGRRALEGDVDPVVVLGQRGDRVTEDVLHRVLAVLVQDAGEVAAEDLHVAAHQFRRQIEARGAVGVDDRLAAHVGLVRVDVVVNAERGQDGAVHPAAEVDRESALAQGGGLLDDGDAGSVQGQGEGDGGTGDAGAGDQDVEVGQSGRCVRGVCGLHVPERRGRP